MLALIGSAVGGLSVQAEVRLFLSRGTGAPSEAGLKDLTHLYDDTEGSERDGDHYELAGVPDVEAPILNVADGDWVYLWLRFEDEADNAKLQGLACSIVVGGAGFEEDARGVYRFLDKAGSGLYRWENGSETEDVITLVSVVSNGIVNSDQPSDDLIYDPATRTALLGAFRFASTGDPVAGPVPVYVRLEDNGISFRQAPRPQVILGADDFDVFNGNPPDEGVQGRSPTAWLADCTTGTQLPLVLVANAAADTISALGGLSRLPIRTVADGSSGLDDPNGLLLDSNQNLYVSSVETDSVIKYSLRTGQKLLEINKDRLSGPDGLGLRGSKLLVSAYYTDSVKEYNATTGEFIQDFVRSGRAGLDGPGGLLVLPNNNVLVCSQNTNEVLEFEASAGAFVRVAAAGNGLAVPAGLARDAAGDLYVASYSSDSVLKFKPDGTFVTTFVASGSGGLNGASDLTFAPNGNLLVVSRLTEEILEYAGDDGSFLRVWAGGEPLGTPTRVLFAWVCDEDCNGNRVLDDWDGEFPPPEITQQPQGTAACVGAAAEFEVAAVGNGRLSYQWRRNDIDIAGATESIYRIDPVESGDAGAYSVVVQDGCGSILSEQATLTVLALAQLLQEPADLVACAGSSATFKVTAGGTGPISYQWRRGGVPIDGATDATFEIDPVSESDAGSYDVVVSNECNSVASREAKLTVRSPARFTLQPADESGFERRSATLEVAVDGAPPITVQWRKDGVAIPGATGNKLTLDPLTRADAGEYDVAATNECGVTISQIAVLTVFPVADLNCDSTVTFDDIDPFVIAITSRSKYAQLFPDCDVDLADINNDGSTDFDDIDPFVECLINGGCG